MRKRTVEFIVSYGYGMSSATFKTEAEARPLYERKALVPSYLNPEKMEPVTLTKVVTIVEQLENSRA